MTAADFSSREPPRAGRSRGLQSSGRLFSRSRKPGRVQVLLPEHGYPIPASHFVKLLLPRAQSAIPERSALPERRGKPVAQHGRRRAARRVRLRRTANAASGIRRWRSSAIFPLTRSRISNASTTSRASAVEPPPAEQRLPTFWEKMSTPFRKNSLSRFAPENQRVAQDGKFLDEALPITECLWRDRRRVDLDSASIAGSDH